MITPGDEQAFRAAWPVYARHHEELTRVTATWAANHAEFGPIVSGRHGAVLLEVDPPMPQLVAGAMASGNWAHVLARLRTEGRAYAQAGVTLSAWFDLMGHFRSGLLAHVRDEASDDVGHLLLAIDGAHWFADLALRAIAEGYLETKQELLRTEVGERTLADRRMTALVSSSDDAIIGKTLDGTVTSWNAGAERIYGYAENEVVGRNVALIVPSNRVGELADILAGVALGKTARLPDSQRMCKDGTLIDVSLVISPIRDQDGEIVGASTIARDITERKRNVEALQASAARKAAILESALDCVITIDHNGQVIEFNAAAERTFGYSRANVLGLQLADLIIPPSLRDKHRRALNHCVVTGEGPILGQRLEMVAQRADGSEFPIELSVTRVDGPGKPIFTGYIRDLSEKKQAAEELAQSERRYRLLFEANPLPMWIYDRATLAFLEVNDAAVAHYGYSRDEFLSMTIKDIRPPDDVPALLDDLARTGASDGVNVWRHLKHDGTVIEVEITSHAVAFGDHLAQFAMAEDVTDQRRLQRQLQQSQRMDSLGQLAGGIAHDFNNLLAVIMNYAAFVKKETARAAVDEDRRWGPVSDDVAQIEHAVDRASRLTRQLLAFARREVTRPEVISLNSAVAEVEQLLRRTLGEHVELVTSRASDLRAIVADAGQLEQVLINLAVNARDAMPTGGTLTIETANVDVDRHYAASRPGVVPGGYVCLRVSDTGTGMDPNVLQHAFEPFFTTKPTGEGTGLGLATVYGIITQAGGHAQIYSEPLLGTTFTALFPAATGELTAHPEDVPEARRLSGGETVLIVEDEDALRKVTSRILSSNGYRVLTAANGREAIELARTSGGQIDLVLTDVVMPHMLGNEVAKAIESIQAGVRVLYMSGYAQPVLASQGTLDPGVSLVEKPFSERTLLAKVRDALEHEPNGNAGS
jgi:PAS domain S-box-containing protein